MNNPRTPATNHNGNPERKESGAHPTSESHGNHGHQKDEHKKDDHKKHANSGRKDEGEQHESPAESHPGRHGH
ncbi:MAG: hypothetical protein GY946_30775 [bacterium]|nr:hypothetical protein [bacterium]